MENETVQITIKNKVKKIWRNSGYDLSKLIILVLCYKISVFEF